MAHEVESMAFVGDTPWHGIGVQVPPGIDTPAMLQASGLAGWGLEKVHAGAEVGGKFVAADDRFFVRRTDIADGPLLGPITGRYEVLQNEEAFSVFEPAVEAGLIQYETAISLQRGRMVVVLAKVINTAVDVVKNDEMNLYLLLTTAHDGTRRVSFKPTAVRVVCANTLRAALRVDQESETGIPHTRKMRDALKLLSEKIQVVQQSYRDVTAAYRLMAKKRLSDRDAQAVLAFLRPDPPKNPEKAQQARGRILHLAAHGRGNEKHAGTAWGLMNGVTEYLSYEYGVDAETRLVANHWNVAARTRNRAFDVLTSVSAGVDVSTAIATVQRAA